MARSATKALYNGGFAALNPCGKGWTVDVWSYEQEQERAETRMTPDPTYHAFHQDHEDALADFGAWEPWPAS